MILFVPLFIFRRIGPLDFWIWMSVNAIILNGLAAFSDASWREAIFSDLSKYRAKKIAIGLVGALFLYGVFFAGNWLSRMLLPFAETDINLVYEFKGGTSPLLIGCLMALLIGPGEELFWRGFLQRRLAVHLGKWRGFFFATALYTIMHAGSLNPMLLVAALFCGAFWGWLYMRTGSLLTVVASHVAWDISVFLIFPFTSY